MKPYETTSASVSSHPHSSIWRTYRRRYLRPSRSSKGHSRVKSCKGAVCMQRDSSSDTFLAKADAKCFIVGVVVYLSRDCNYLLNIDELISVTCWWQRWYPHPGVSVWVRKLPPSSITWKYICYNEKMAVEIEDIDCKYYVGNYGQKHVNVSK